MADNMDVDPPNDDGKQATKKAGKEKEGGKKKKAVTLKSKVKITGRKENVEEAKKRILGQVERLVSCYLSYLRRSSSHIS